MTCDDLSFSNTMQKTLKPSKKNVSIPKMNEKKLHTLEFQLKGISGNIRCKLLQKRSTGKTTEWSKHLQHTSLKKIFFSEFNRCIFQISQKYIKLVIPKIFFILKLYNFNFNFYFKIMCPPPQQYNPLLPTKIKISHAPPPKKYPPLPKLEGRVGGGGACHSHTLYLKEL